MINLPARDPARLPQPGHLSAPSTGVRGRDRAPGVDGRIPFVDVHVERIARAARGAIASGWVSNGPEVASFETEFAAVVGARCGVAVSSGTTALELALESLRLPMRSPVLISALGSVGLAQAVVQAGHYPVLVDVSPETGMPTPELVRAAARRPERKDHPARAMVVTHLSGNPADARALAQAAALPSDRVVEDASEALGSTFGETRVGGGGTVCFSFYSSANLPIGQGGMVATEYPDLADRVRRARPRGASPQTWRQHLKGNPLWHRLRDGGLDASLTDLSAAIGRAQLAHLKVWQQRRTTLAELYDARLAGIPGLSLPHRPPAGTGQHGWHHYPLRIEGSEAHVAAVSLALAEAGIGTAEPLVPLHRLRHVSDLCEVPPDGLPGADLFVKQVLSLPVYPRVPNNAADRVGDVMSDALQGPAGGLQEGA